MELTAEAATNLAVQNQRMNKGVSTLSSNWSSWLKTLRTSDKLSTDYAKTVVELTDTIADLIGASEDFEIPKGFLDVEENLDLIDSAAEGSIKAIDALGIAVAKAEFENLEFISGGKHDAGSDGLVEYIQLDDFETAKQTMIAGLNEL
jgi:hypothetical protein